MKTWLVGVGSSLFGVTLLGAVACGDDAPAPAKDEPDASMTSPTPDVFNGDCSTAKWTRRATDECWACMCAACADTLNKCDVDCADLMTCGLDEHVLVGEASQLACEGRAFTASCVKAETSKASADAVTAFDICLIGSHKPPERLRVCEEECKIRYTDDVCERFPEGDAG